MAPPPGIARSTRLPAVQRRKLATKNKRQAERRAREVADLIQKEDWEALSKLDWKPKAHSGTFSLFVRDEFLPKYCTWGESTRRGEEGRLRVLCEQFGTLPLSRVHRIRYQVLAGEAGGGGVEPCQSKSLLG